MGLSFTKLLTWVFPKQEVRIVMVGLDAAGKTTILYKLKLGKVVTTIPTIGLNVETVEYKNINFTIWETGGSDRVKIQWNYYFHNIQGIIYVIDSTDRRRIAEAKDLMHSVLNEDVMKEAILLVFVNKQDLPNAVPSYTEITDKLELAMDITEITDKLELHSLTQRSWHIQSTCAKSGKGLYEGLDWLSAKIIANQV